MDVMRGERRDYRGNRRNHFISNESAHQKHTRDHSRLTKFRQGLGLFLKHEHGGQKQKRQSLFLQLTGRQEVAEAVIAPVNEE